MRIYTLITFLILSNSATLFSQSGTNVVKGTFTSYDMALDRLAEVANIESSNQDKRRARRQLRQLFRFPESSLVINDLQEISGLLDTVKLDEYVKYILGGVFSNIRIRTCKKVEFDKVPTSNDDRPINQQADKMVEDGNSIILKFIPLKDNGKIRMGQLKSIIREKEAILVFFNQDVSLKKRNNEPYKSKNLLMALLVPYNQDWKIYGVRAASPQESSVPKETLDLEPIRNKERFYEDAKNLFTNHTDNLSRFRSDPSLKQSLTDAFVNPKNPKIDPDIPITQSVSSLSNYRNEVRGFHYYNREDSVINHTDPSRINCSNSYSLTLRTHTVTKVVKEEGGDTLRIVAKINYAFIIDTESGVPIRTKIDVVKYTIGRDVSFTQEVIPAFSDSTEAHDDFEESNISYGSYITRLYTDLNAFVSGRLAIDSVLAHFNNKGEGITVRVSHCNDKDLDTSFNSVKDYLLHFSELGYESMNFSSSLLSDSAMTVTPDCYEKNCVFTVPVEQRFRSYQANGKLIYGDQTWKEIQLVRLPGGDVFIGNIEVLETKGCIK